MDYKTFVPQATASDWQRRLSNPIIAQAMIGGGAFYQLFRQWGALRGQKRSLDYSFDQSDVPVKKVAPNPAIDDFFRGNTIKSIRILIADPNYYPPGKTPFDPISPYIKLDFIPEKIDVTTAGKFNNLNIIGLNFPRFHWSGGNSVVRFTIDWFDFMNHKDRVEKKCLKLQALTRADGWRKGPPTVYINWGDGELFKDQEFLVQSANYEMSHFLPYRSEPIRYSGQGGYANAHTPNGLLPLQAKQDIVLLRVGPQLTHKQLIENTK